VRTTSPECPEAIFMMCFQSIYGVMSSAFMAGIVFAKMTRAKQRAQTLLFSKHAVICQRDGCLSLMFRVGDMRKSHIIGAGVSDIVICCCQYEEMIWVEYSVNKDFQRQMDLQNRWHQRKIYSETLEKITAQDLPEAIKLYINNLKLMVQTTRTLIYSGKTRATRMRCIVKMVNKQYMNYTCEDPYIEADVLRHLQSHPNIVELMYSVEEERYMYMVLEYLDWDVEELLQEYGSMSEENARSVVRGTAAGLTHMQQLQIIHRDIKPGNLLIRFSSTSGIDFELVKIADFGMSAYYRGSKLHSCCGTPCYMAPELVAESGYDYQVDSWSLGVTLFQLLYGKLPFGNFSQIVVEVYAAIMSVEPSYPKEMEGLLSPEAKNLIDGLLMKNPSKRLTIAEVVQHPFLAQ